MADEPDIQNEALQHITIKFWHGINFLQENGECLNTE